MIATFFPDRVTGGLGTIHPISNPLSMMAHSVRGKKEAKPSVRIVRRVAGRERDLRLTNALDSDGKLVDSENTSSLARSRADSTSEPEWDRRNER